MVRAAENIRRIQHVCKRAVVLLFTCMFEGCARSQTPKQHLKLVSKITVAKHTAQALQFIMWYLFGGAPDSTHSPEDIKISRRVLVLLENLVTFDDYLFDNNGLWLSDATSMETHRCLLKVGCQRKPTPTTLWSMVTYVTSSMSVFKVEPQVWLDACR